MAENLKKRGRKPKMDGEKMERASSVRYKCPYDGCGLEYHSSLGYKRHLMYYKHHLFTPAQKIFRCGVAGCSETRDLKTHFRLAHAKDEDELLEAHDLMLKTSDSDIAEGPQMDNDIVHDEGLLDITRVMEEKGVIKDVIMETFPRGVTHIIDFDTFSEQSPVFYCRIPGCGRQFKSLMAYKYHCGKFTHSFKTLVEAYTKNHGHNYEEVRDAFRKRFSLENRFLLEGISHHLMRMPDQHYNFIFTFDDVQNGGEKRRGKRRGQDGSLTEYSVSRESYSTETENQEEAEAEADKDKMKRRKKSESENGSVGGEGEERRRREEEDFESGRVDSVAFNGKRIGQVDYYTQGRITFLNTKVEITCTSSFRSFFIVGAKGERRGDYECIPYNIFNFSSGPGILLFLSSDLSVVKEVDLGSIGFPRKIVPISSAPHTLLVLSNDGMVRKLVLSDAFEVVSLSVYDQVSSVVSFEVVGDFFYATDGYTLKKIRMAEEDGKRRGRIEKEMKFDCPITNLGKSLGSVITCDTNGKILLVDEQLESKRMVVSKVGNVFAKGIGGGEREREVFIANSLDGLGRVCSVGEEGVKTTVASPHSSTNILTIKGGFIATGSLNGIITISNYLERPKTFMDAVRMEIQGDELHITTSQKEHALKEEGIPPRAQDYRVCVQGIEEVDRSLVASISCGVVISVTHFFRSSLS